MEEPVATVVLEHPFFLDLLQSFLFHALVPVTSN
jgi:hypothetical protein